MLFSVGDALACATGFLFPYSLFLGWRPPFNLRLDMTDATRLEKLSYKWLKPLLGLSGMFFAGAAYADRRSEDPMIFGLLLAASFLIWFLTAPAGFQAFRLNYGWDKRHPRRDR